MDSLHEHFLKQPKLKCKYAFWKWKNLVYTNGIFLLQFKILVSVCVSKEKIVLLKETVCCCVIVGRLIDHSLSRNLAPQWHWVQVKNEMFSFLGIQWWS